MGYEKLLNKKVFSWILIYLLAVITISQILPTTSSAGDGNIAPVESDLGEIRVKGSLVVLTEYGPNTYYIEKDQPAGYYYELFQKWGKDNNINVSFVVVNNRREMFEKLLNGTGDVVAAYSYKDNRPNISYSKTLWSSQLVLLQRNEKTRVKNVSGIDGKGIWVENNTNHLEWLQASLSKTAITPFIHLVPESTPLDSMAKYISEKKYDYLVTDPQEASRLATAYKGLDATLQVGNPLEVALAFRSTSPALLESFNGFIATESKTLNELYATCFQKEHVNEEKPEVVFNSKISISAFDNIIKKYAQKIQWDWKLLASLICQESGFNPNARGLGGAGGLMQLMPATAQRFGALNVYHPEENISSGVAYIKALNKIWSNVPDPVQRHKFILASYNIGEGHVLDAVRLARKYGADPYTWDDNVEVYLAKKKEKAFYTDPVVKFGYCNGTHACKYVESVYTRFQKYLGQG